MRRPILPGHARWKKSAPTLSTAWWALRPIVRFVLSYVRRPMASDATVTWRREITMSGLRASTAMWGLFTCRESFGEDLTELFNLLTGYTRPRKFQHLF